MCVRYCPTINLWLSYDIWIRLNRSLGFYWFFLAIFIHFDLHLIFYLIDFIYFSIINSLIWYQNHEVTSTRNPMIHIHINEICWFIFRHFHFSKVTISSLRRALIIKLHMQDVLNLPHYSESFSFWLDHTENCFVCIEPNVYP